ncbi:MAG: methyltransferase domain-containing protein [Alphaproteobacteria bacterium]|nr:methyltransferase domain-containing protein [Alphaproteobacteria bacterium]
MQIDAGELANFYETPLGQVARRTILRRVRALWPDVHGERVLGYGFATPYLRAFLSEAERVIAMMPAQQGVVAWPSGRVLSVLGEEDALPFADALFDRILMIHALESADATRPLMRQIWRVLQPGGRLLIIAPNRRSPWSLAETSPFAQGRPFSAAQLARVLGDCLFVPERWDCALLFPPLPGRRLVRTGRGWTRIGQRLWPGLAGVHVVEARKTLYGAPSLAPTVRRRFMPARVSG